MTKEYCEIIALNSTMLGRILSNLDDNMMQSFSGMLANENVKKFFADKELVETATNFFRNDLNIISASKSLEVHRNTTIYRLEKIKKLLGLDIKKFEDAVTLQIIMHLQQMAVKRKKVAKRSSKPLKIEIL